ncbi:RNA-processing protein, HAT helix [Corchorus capsularis]|uniref:RNA-processing protein, HAT helix n=1 Tax=Corchorus capsularis TaxID=210143 RepID=A0A1R3GKV9_COCAP|nr:RNA-processing protein, HAT helix [Corchorus capsularis]
MEVGEAKRLRLRVALDMAGKKLSGLTAAVDPETYLRDLAAIKNRTDEDISNIKQARMVLKAVTRRNPRVASGWISLARFEELTGDMEAARRVIEKGCQNCPKNQDLWLEGSRLAGPDERKMKAMIVRALKAIPNSSRLMLESDVLQKSRVLRRGIENIPNSVILWKALIDMVDEDNIEVAVLLLNKAVECCPTHADFWLALARLLPLKEAREALERARQQLPGESAIVIAQARLEEAGGGADRDLVVGNIIEGFIRELERQGLYIDRRAWMEKAEVAERLGCAVTCQAIIRNTIGIGMGRDVEVSVRKLTWIAEARELTLRGSLVTARATYAYTLSVFYSDTHIWKIAEEFEFTYGFDISIRRLHHARLASLAWRIGEARGILATICSPPLWV